MPGTGGAWLPRRCRTKQAAAVQYSTREAMAKPPNKQPEVPAATIKRTNERTNEQKASRGRKKEDDEQLISTWMAKGTRRTDNMQGREKRDRQGD